MIQTWRKLPIVVPYSIEYIHQTKNKKNWIVRFCVFCRPDFDRFCHIYSFLPISFFNVLAKVTLYTILILFTNTTHHRVSTQNVLRYVFCLFLRVIERPDQASKYPIWAQKLEKMRVLRISIHQNETCMAVTSSFCRIQQRRWSSHPIKKYKPIFKFCVICRPDFE